MTMTFKDLLKHHMQVGTGYVGPRKSWTPKELADKLELRGGGRTVRNWLAGKNAPGEPESLIRVLFREDIGSVAANQFRLAVSQFKNTGRRPSTEGADSRLLSFRGRQTQALLIEGDGIIPFDLAHLSIRIGAAPLMPRDIEDAISAIYRDPPEGKNDDPQFSLLSFNADTAPGEESHRLDIEVFVNSYFHYLGTNAVLSKAEQEGVLESNQLYRKYLADRTSDQPVPHLANGLGVIVAVTTRDHEFVSGRRSSRSGILPGIEEAIIAEGMNSKDKSGINTLDPLRTAQRAVSEELGIQPEDLEKLSIIGFATDRSYHQYNLIAHAQTNLDRAKLTQRFALRRGTKWELSSLRFTPPQPNNLIELLTTTKIGMPTLAVGLALTNLGYADGKNSIFDQVMVP